MQTNSIQPSSSSSTTTTTKTIKINSASTLELTELDICLARCTNPLTKITDELIDQLCRVTNSQTNGPYTTLRFLAYKAQSPQESEALHSLFVLDLVAKRGGFRIADELGKFRFLNEIIKIVSPKYLAHQTSAKVGQRIIELIFQWSMDFKELPKIFEAYQMLKVQKIVLDDPVHVLKNYRPPTPPKPRPKHEIFDDEQTVKTLRSLIESGRTEQANQLIKNLAIKAESRDQFKANFVSELESARNCSHLLNEMVIQSNNNLKIDSETKRVVYRGTTDEDLQLMRELLTNCETIRFRLYRFSNQITENDHEELRQLIEISDMLMSTINSCKRYFILLDDPKLSQTTTTTDTYDNVLDNNNPMEEERLLDLNTTPLASPKRISLENIDDDLDYSLNDNNCNQESMLQDLITTTTTTKTKLNNHRTLSTLDSHSNLNQLTDMFERQNLSNDPKKFNNHQNGKMISSMNNQQQQQPNQEFKDLSELLASINQICYEDIQPCREMRPPLIVFNENGLVVNLHFTDNKPHQQVSVFLLTFTNYNQSTINDIHFWAAVPKRMKVKLQYQTGSTLPGLKNGQNFPEIFISQVMLIACDRNYFIDNHSNKDTVNQQQQPNSSIINNDHNDQQHFQTQESNRHHSSIQYKLKYKLTFLIDGNYSEHVSQLLWWS